MRGEFEAAGDTVRLLHGQPSTAYAGQRALAALRDRAAGPRPVRPLAVAVPRPTSLAPDPPRAAGSERTVTKRDDPGRPVSTEIQYQALRSRRTAERGSHKAGHATRHS
jgi:hypothetical protein